MGSWNRTSLAAAHLVLVMAVLLAPAAAETVQIYDTFPDDVHPGERYVIYSHGLIVEGDDPRPVHPEFGVYDFPAITSALFEDGGFNLIAHQRPKNTDVDAYVDTLESWVLRLVAAGVTPERITLIGFSRGAQLTGHASSRLRMLGFGTALMAVCNNGDLVRDPPVVLGGPVLSIYETTDVVGSCAGLARRSGLAAFEEIAISTGKRHGAFYQPLPEWLAPLKAWIAGTNRDANGR
jgi:hypothetical protein